MGSRYEAVVANRMHDAPEETVSVAGKFCESGDVLIKGRGAAAFGGGRPVGDCRQAAHITWPWRAITTWRKRPAVVFVRDGSSRLVRRRQAYADLIALDVLPEGS